VAAVLLLLATGPMMDWRRVARAWTTGIVTTVAMVVLIVLARLLAGMAIRRSGMGEVPLLESSGPASAFFRSPLDFLASSLFTGALVAVAVSTLDLWRVARRGFGAIPVDTPGRRAAFVAGNVAAGGAVTALVIGYEAFLRF